MEYKVFDIETNTLNPYEPGAYIFAYCVGDWNGNVDVRRLDRDEASNKRNKQFLIDFMLDTTIAKIAHNFKFELAFMKVCGWPVPEGTVWEDTMLMSQLLRNLAPSHALENLCWELCGYPKDIDDKVKEMGKAYGGYQRIPEAIMHPYQVADGQRPMLLYRSHIDRLKSDEALYEDYLNEVELVKATEHFENFGIKLDIEETDKLLEETKAKFKRVEKETYSHFGEYFNLNSDTQVARILYKMNDYPLIKITESGAPSVDKHVIAELKETYEDPVFDLILQSRSYSNAVSTMKGYQKLADNNNIIHPNVKTNHARTGRESCAEPNLHNVRKREALLNPFPVAVRRCFRAHTGYVLYLPDYASIEMRLIIDAAAELELIKVAKEGRDLHYVFTEFMYDGARGKDFCRQLKESDPGTFKTIRNACKNGHFALSYGAGLAKVASTCKLSTEEARPGFERYRKTFSGVSNYTPNMHKKAREQGYVLTPFGRKLYLSPAKSHAAGNYLIQGTAAGIVKRAQVRVDKYCREEWDDKIRIVIPIHDEIIIAVPKEMIKYQEIFTEDIGECMRNMPEIQIPLEVEWKMTENTWDDAKELEVAA